MLDWNDLRVFERVAAQGSFTAAARVLGMPKASVSRSVARLEAELGVALIQRTTRHCTLTAAGKTLLDRSAKLVADVRGAVDEVAGLSGRPRGLLRVGSGIGFGINVLSRHLPVFLERYPDVRVRLDLSSQRTEPVGAEPDVAVRVGPLADSSAQCVLLGRMSRYLCAAPAYVERRGVPASVEAIRDHDTVEMPRGDGRPRVWEFTRDGVTERVSLEEPRVTVNEALTIHRLVLHGVGLGVISGYLCDPELKRGDLVRLFPDWTLPPVDVHLVFARGRELSAAARAFVNFLKQTTRPGDLWMKDVD